MVKIFSQIILLLIISCSSSGLLTAKNDDISWYLSPAQNNNINIYGAGQGNTLEEATKSALSDASARLSVTISSSSTTLLEENRHDVNEEFRKQISQNIEKIEFPNFVVTRSAKKDQSTYVEVSIDRKEFVDLQKEKIEFLDNQVSNLQRSIGGQNIIQKRSSYTKIIDLAGRSEILTRIVFSASNDQLKKKLKIISDAKYSLSKLNSKFEFYFSSKGNLDIYRVIRKHLNRAGVLISSVKSNANNQIGMSIESSSNSGKVYGANITKIRINFKNISKNKIIASNDVEISGSSTISKKESYKSAIKSFDELVEKKGVFLVLGVE